MRAHHAADLGESAAYLGVTVLGVAVLGTAVLQPPLQTFQTATAHVILTIACRRHPSAVICASTAARHAAGSRRVPVKVGQRESGAHLGVAVLVLGFAVDGTTVLQPPLQTFQTATAHVIPTIARRSDLSSVICASTAAQTGKHGTRPRLASHCLSQRTVK